MNRRLVGLMASALMLEACAPGALGPALSGTAIVDFIRGFEPHRYLAVALDDMEQVEYYGDRIDWSAIRRQAFQQAAGARTAADTYPAIVAAAASLHTFDNHSSFFPASYLPFLLGLKSQIPSVGLTIIVSTGVVADVDPGSPAERAGVRLGDIVESVDGQTPRQFAGDFTLYSWFGPGQGSIRAVIRHPGDPTATFVLEPAPLALNIDPSGREIGTVGYLNVPQFVDLSRSDSASAAFAFKLARLVEEQDRAGSCGWIIDLRQNSGGNVFPMTAGLGALLGNGTYAYVSTRTARFPLTNPASSHRLRHSHPPVAVLTSPLTASSGELVAVAFRGRPEWRSFGEPTYGASSGTNQFYLSDGAVLNVMNTVDVDRTGRKYGVKLPPDEPVAIDWARYNAPDDPVIAAAVGWLQQQTACA